MDGATTGGRMRVGNVRRLHSGCGWIVTWRMEDPGWMRPGGRRPAAESFFFAAVDCAPRAEFDALREGDRVEFLPVEPEPPRGPRAYAVRRIDADHD